MEIIHLGKRRELFWDDYLPDLEKTTAFRRLNRPVLRECVFVLDSGKETTSISYPQLLKNENGYRLYYAAHDGHGGGNLSVIESTDGKEWHRPNLNVCDCPTYPINNVVLNIPDNMFVFYDPNPACPPEEKYKAIGAYPRDDETGGGLVCFISADGYRFSKSHVVTTDGHFDTLNTIIWRDGRYSIYFRSFHDSNGNDAHEWNNENIRDVRVIHSTDFKTWTKQKLIRFTDALDYPLYTNNVSIYPRAPHMLIGFPTRYCERKVWTDNETQMASSAVKRTCYEKEEKRAGLAVTDCIFMCSRDGETWHRENEAFMTPGYENAHNWVYGDCYPSYDLLDSGAENYYIYTIDNHRSRGVPKPLNRYEIRKDGFVCFRADETERVLVTKPLVFEGSKLHLNFATSAYGYIFVDVLDENGEPLSQKQSFEIYGDTIDRTVLFEDGSDFSDFAGKPIRLRFRMRDASLFSLIFE